MYAVLIDWAELLIRWLHVIAGIAWIGSSFYFIWLDLTLVKRSGLPDGVSGENWSVHGGGFYNTRKYMVAPDSMPDDLHWFKWESYATWVSGFALLVVMYYLEAESYLIDREVMDLSPGVAIAISAGSLVAGWGVYDLLCKSPLRHDQRQMFFVLFVLIVAAAWGFAQVFSARAAFLHVGAVIATIMSANVFLVIIPNQKIVVADLIAGRTPDPEYGRIAKLRSTHNNYLTLPVLFMMISNHYPMTFGHPWNWVIVAFVLAIGAIVRDFFNARNSGKTGTALKWQWPTASALVVAMIAFSNWQPGEDRIAELEDTVFTPDALAISQVHCTSCHAAVPRHPDFEEAPGGVMMETAEQLRTHASKILAQAVLSEAMPLGNPTGMTEEERLKLGAWIRSGMPDE